MDSAPLLPAGKSGEVTIRFDYTNHQYELLEIDGKQEKIYVPFAMLTGLMLDNDVFTNVSVVDGVAAQSVLDPIADDDLPDASVGAGQDVYRLVLHIPSRVGISGQRRHQRRDPAHRYRERKRKRELYHGREQFLCLECQGERYLLLYVSSDFHIIGQIQGITIQSQAFLEAGEGQPRHDGAVSCQGERYLLPRKS